MYSFIFFLLLPACCLAVTKDVKECKKSGLMCDSCTTVSECIDIGGSYFKREMYKCTAGSCSETTGNCSSIPNPECDANIKLYQPTCFQTGVFPRAFNSCQYYICVPKTDGSIDVEAIEMSCHVGFAYDPLTTLCKIKLENNSCSLVVEPCNVPFKRGEIMGNPSLYYICVPRFGVLVPQIFVCPGDLIFDKIKGACRRLGKKDSGRREV